MQNVYVLKKYPNIVFYILYFVFVFWINFLHRILSDYIVNVAIWYFYFFNEEQIYKNIALRRYSSWTILWH